jgi:hypothetical protein
LRCAVEDVKLLNEKVYHYSKRILSKLIFDNPECLDDKEILSVETWKQSQRVDLWVEVKIKNDTKKYALIIEDKMYNPLKKGQLDVYYNLSKDHYSDKLDYEVKHIFLRGADDFQATDEQISKEAGYNPVLLHNLKSVIGEERTDNDIFDEFWFNWWK